MTDSFEGDLAALRPLPAAGQASFYFRAGQVSRERSVRTWQRVAGGALALLLGTVGASFWRIADAEERASEAEAQRVRNPVVVRVPEELAPSPSPQLIEEDSRPYAPPMSPRVPDSDPTAAEMAATLELRKNILTAGTTYLDSQSRKTR